MCNIKNIVFDLGGVLIDWNPDYVFRHIYPDPVKRAWFFEHICTHEWNLRQDAGYPLAQATEEKVAQFPEYATQIRAFYGRWEEMLGDALHDTVEILEELVSHPKYRVLALTNWSHETFPVALERFDFLQWFEDIVISGVEKTIKPEAKIYDILLTRNGLTAAETVFIDDSQKNVTGAKALQIEALHFTSAARLRSDLLALGVDLRA